MSHISLSEALEHFPHSIKSLIPQLLPTHVSGAERAITDSRFLGGSNIVTVIDRFPTLTQCQIISNIYLRQKPKFLEDLHSLSQPPALSEKEYASGDEEQESKKASFAPDFPLCLGTMEPNVNLIIP